MKRDFQKGYKHNVEIWKKNMAKIELKIEMFTKKLQGQNEEFKGSITRLKLHDEELQDLRQKSKIQETTKGKWIEALFLHK